MIRRLAEKSGATFLLVFLWKVALLLFTAQPVPNNDAFFYDGPVVNYLLHGKYCNPSLVNALPISGGEVFCAYPPLHQLVLLGWMKIFGTSALAAMWLHVALLGVYFLILLAIFRRLALPAHLVNLAGLFLFGITFHDRPDTVAHVLGMLAVFGLVSGGRGVWVAMAALVLAFSASLQIGGVYLLCAVLHVAGNAWSGREAVPWMAVLGGGCALVALVAFVKFGFPHLWAGFQEHVGITPSVTGLRKPAMLDLLKAARTAPALVVVALAVVMAFVRGRMPRATLRESLPAVLAIAGAGAGAALIAASLLVLTPNTVHIANYLQPFVVGAFLAAPVFHPAAGKPSRCWLIALVVLALMTGTRAIGLTTWGVACSRDVSYSEALKRIRTETERLPADSTVIASAAFLYDLAANPKIKIVHNDWAAAPGDFMWEYRAYGKLRPARIILTQFDYYRRFGTIVEQLKSHPDVASLQIINTARVPPPDSIPKFSRLVQHVSWAPVIVELNWR